MATEAPQLLPTLKQEPDPVKAVTPLPVGWIVGLLSVVLAASVLLAIGIGTVQITPKELLAIVLHRLGVSTQIPFREEQEIIFWYIRLPRVCLGILIGTGLALAGTTLQGLFRNPLADPTLIGISAGASLAAVLTIVFNLNIHLFGGLLGSYTLAVAAFTGAGLTTLLVYRLSLVNGHFRISTMLLVGIAINAFVMALTGLITSLANDQQLRDLTFWNLGSLGGANWTNVLTITPFILIAAFGMPGLAKSLNLLSLGESQAIHLGVNMKLLKRKTILLSTMAVGASVAMAGSIGFVALIVPHIIRKAFGPDHRIVLPGSALGGAIILTISDTLSRTLVAPSELPIGVLTALMGAPLFVYILLKEKNKRYD